MQQTLQPDSLLQGGKYHIIESLGQGGFGITYLGEQISLGRKVAIKEFFMKDLCNRDEETSQVSVGSEGSREMVNRFREKFVKEARNIASLNHRHIVSVIDIFEENGTAYYVMEYCNGGSLSVMMRQQYPDGMPEERALKYIRQIASALDYVHKRRMNHLDVKPGNIMLSEVDDAILIDFGLAKQYDSTTGQQTSSTPVGVSEGYAPMEQYKLGGVGTFSPPTDIYSLGATLYKLVTGQTPPSALDIDEVDLSDFPLSPSVKRAIRAAMGHRRTDRPQSIEAWLKLLDAEPIAVMEEEEETTRINDLQQKKAEQERLRKEAGVKAEAAHKAREEAERKNKETSAVQAMEPATKKPWLWGVVAVVALLLVWLVWPAERYQYIASGSENGYDYVDLGLKDSKGRTIYWATCNVGASKPEEYGQYFAWGETTGYTDNTNDGHEFNWDNYKWCSGLEKTITKYFVDSVYESVNDIEILFLEDDAAHVNWGGSWRMPTEAEQEQLCRECKWTWDSWKKGYIVKGPNGNSIFLPAAGCRSESDLYGAGSYGDYWSSSNGLGYTYDAIHIFFNSDYVDWNCYESRECGRSVRAVCVSSE